MTKQTRESIVALANSLMDDEVYYARMAAWTASQRSIAVAARSWAHRGMQSVCMPATYEAALMATDSRAALVDEPMPWPAFEIRPSSDTLATSAGRVFSIIASDPFGAACANPDHRLIIAIHQPGCSMVATFPSVAAAYDADAWGSATMDDGFWNDDADARLWLMAARLVGGVVLAINHARESDDKAFPASATRIKNGERRPSNHQLGKPLTIDCRQAVRAFVTGAGIDPRVTSLRRGHWRNQPYGPGSTLRRRTWIYPTWVGEGPRLVRPVRLGF